LAIITMTVGNVTAISQNSVKRLLAYSSIAQAGYILMGVAAANHMGVKGVLVYLATYLFTNAGAFFCVMAAANTTGSDNLDSFAGLSRRAPMLAGALTVFLLSLAGIPPLAGFVGKYFVFAAAIQGGYLVLAAAAAVNSAIAAFYYFRIVRAMYLTAPATEEPFCPGLAFKVLIGITLAGTLVLGIFPSPLITLVENCFH